MNVGNFFFSRFLTQNLQLHKKHIIDYYIEECSKGRMGKCVRHYGPSVWKTKTIQRLYNFLALLWKIQ